MSSRRARRGRRVGGHRRRRARRRLYERVFVEYGDDSVAQLGGVHLACEQSSQLLAKALEWGRLAAYLEQSTRYMRYDDRPGGAVARDRAARARRHPTRATYDAFLDEVFTTYGRMYEPLETCFSERFPKEPDDSDFVYRQTMLAKTCDTLRVLLPAGTRSNLGIYATGQSYEQLLMRLALHPLAEMRAYGDLMLVELRKVIPEFLKRVDVASAASRGRAYWQATSANATKDAGREAASATSSRSRGRSSLVDHDPEGELKVTAAVLYAHSDLPDDQLLSLAAVDDARAASGDPARRASASAGTGGTSPGARGSARSTGSTCCATTGRSATSSATARSRSSGSASPPNTASRRRARSMRRACASDWDRVDGGECPHGTRAPRRPACRTSRSTRCPWPSASGS